MSNVDTSTFQIRRIYQKTKTKQIISRKLLKRIYYFGYKYSSKNNLISKCSSCIMISYLNTISTLETISVLHFYSVVEIPVQVASQQNLFQTLLRKNIKQIRRKRLEISRDQSVVQDVAQYFKHDCFPVNTSRQKITHSFCSFIYFSVPPPANTTHTRLLPAQDILIHLAHELKIEPFLTTTPIAY